MGKRKIFEILVKFNCMCLTTTQASAEQAEVTYVCPCLSVDKQNLGVKLKLLREF